MKQIEKLLPEYNCGECGRRSCREFVATLVDVEDISKCSFLQQAHFKDRMEQIAALMASTEKKEEIVGVLDGLHADFALAPLPGEPSCREDLYPFDHTAILKPGDIFRYRPLGCPISHIAKVLKFNHCIATVHLWGRSIF